MRETVWVSVKPGEREDAESRERWPPVWRVGELEGGWGVAGGGVSVGDGGAGERVGEVLRGELF